MNDKPVFPFVRYGYCHNYHRMDESLKSKVYISSVTFEHRLRTNNYRLFGYDNRYGLVIWIHNSTETLMFIEFVQP